MIRQYRHHVSEHRYRVLHTESELYSSYHLSSFLAINQLKIPIFEDRRFSSNAIILGRKT